MMFGILNLDKPAGWTSRDVVNRVARLIPRGVKCGHAGTLDPLATGVLLVCVGKATRLVPYLHEHLKSYRGTFLLGKQSVTDDTEADLETVPIPPDCTRERLESLLPRFLGSIEQVPPLYSAVKIKGERAYQAARRGEEFELSARTVQIAELQLSEWQQDFFTLEIRCGTGTYIRSLGRDLARSAGTAAAMSALVRTGIGPFSLSSAIPLQDLTRENLPAVMQSPLPALNFLPMYQADLAELVALQHGRRVAPRPEAWVATNPSRIDEAVILAPDHTLAAIARNSPAELAPTLVFTQNSSHAPRSE